jgi:adenylate cyclase
VSWPLRSFRNLTCIDFFFSVQQQFNSRRTFYENKYHTLPFFKAGAHQGLVTAVEVGDVKRDIAYHGDTLNVAARLEKLCSTYSKPILISEAVKNLEIENSEYKISSLGFQSLAGRESKIEVFGICKA